MRAPTPPAAALRGRAHRLRSGTAIFAALTAAVSATLLVLVGPAGPAVSQQAATGTIRLITPTNPILHGDPATLGGRFRNAPRRPLIIQSAAVGSNSWSTVPGSRQRTTRTGTYRHRFTPLTTRSYRAVLLRRPGKPRRVSTRTTVTVVRGWRSVEAGAGVTCAFRYDRVAYCWGANQYGQLATATGTGSSFGTPVPQRLPIPVAGQRWTQVTAGEQHTCGLLTDRSAWCWGRNDAGQLGNATNVGTSDPNPTPLPVAAPGGRTWLSLHASNRFTCGLTTDRALWCWGSNEYGTLGVATNSGTTTPNPVPVQVVSPSPGTATWRQVDVGRAHACGTVTNGSLWCWGYAWDGRLGPGVTPVDGNHLPAQVTTPTTNWASTSVGSLWSCGLTSTSRLHCWGNNRYGDLGTGVPAGSDTPYPTPVAAPSPANGTVRAVVAGGAFTCATLVDATTWCWGSNRFGALATQTSVGTDTPVPTPVKLPRTYRGLSAGAGQICGLTTQHALECWGGNSVAELGRADGANTLTPQPVPVAVPVPQ